MSANHLFELLEQSARRSPDRVAVEEADGNAVRYGELIQLAEKLSGWLATLDVTKGQRIAICLPKSIDGVATIFGILRSGCAYVPLDPTAPAARNAYIVHNCGVRAVIADRRLTPTLKSELEKLGAAPTFLELDRIGGGNGLPGALAQAGPLQTEPPQHPGRTDLAYLLYTSGSTGMPKGVMISHGNALCFIDWCSDIFEPSAEDRFSSHAPFHFDLSILDLYLPIKHAATVVLIGEALGKEPIGLAELISKKRISNWYSAPSILSMLAQQGRLDQYDWTCLRQVLFAGEVFPIKHLLNLKSKWPKPRYFNLYGPTETNVCTWYELPQNIPADRTEPYPIGKVCGHYRERVIDQDGVDVPQGGDGELCIAGPGVMQGYWNLPEQNDRVFLVDPDGTRWYRTGDIVAQQPDGNYRFLGRRDRMIKKRGYRVELGEIESALYRHPEIKEAAVVADTSDEGTTVRAFVSTKDGQRMSLIALKQFCAQQLPLYMVPDAFTFLPSLPKTSTDKVAYQLLRELS